MTKDAIRAVVDADEGVRAARVLSALRQTYRDPSAAARRRSRLFWSGAAGWSV